MKSAQTFSKALLAWYDKHGRKDLPWQLAAKPYATWLSEIMLQQTQVKTVIPYFNSFIETFPDMKTLAAAPLDEVLSLWSGLGYYARARNLHKCAQRVCAEHNGTLPQSRAALERLPGIGRSTAAAICAQAYEQKEAILDGNVKRVLARYYAISGWPGDRTVQAELWQRSEALLPNKRVATYTQALMDLGALVCTRKKPDCPACPLKKTCKAYLQKQVDAYPTPKPRKALPVREVKMLMLTKPGNEVLLERRPEQGIWGGLWSFPECTVDTDAWDWTEKQLGLRIDDRCLWPSFRHTFSYYHLDITPVYLQVAPPVRRRQTYSWYKLSRARELGVAAPVERLLSQLASLTL